MAASGFLFPALFITIACGAISGYQLVIAVLLMVFAVILAVKGCQTIFGKKEKAQA